ncbi:27 kDa hemolymph protein-like [Anopheles ziemanni]|uniref:27 kDa hemolymph protein-like n=1 Tax=Anopheles ziemanni TaxID=345580 RepID=UPI0026586B27|nr:27 kDa hemolymph protein-like isoform X2 [Anopheles coustani]XP_058167113.1 27 kDa hemolymph protein-like [Anopheles ziemanni]
MGKFLMLAALGVLALFAVTSAMPQPGSDSSSEESAETREFMEEIRTMCRNNSGSDEAYVALMEAFQSAMMCAMTSIDLDSFMSDAYTLSNETRSTFFPKYCPQLKRAGTCLDDLLKAARPCLEEDDFTIVKALTGIFPDAVDLICKNDGEIIFKLDEPKYQECVDKLSDNVMECVVPFAAESEDWDISHLTQTQCGTLSGLRQCIEGKLNVCKAPDLISVYDLFHNMLFRMTPCRNYVTGVEKTKVTEIDNNAINEV